jgi:hypothetical protein
MTKPSSRRRPDRLIFYDKAKLGAGVAAKAFDRCAYGNSEVDGERTDMETFSL